MPLSRYSQNFREVRNHKPRFRFIFCLSLWSNQQVNVLFIGLFAVASLVNQADNRASGFKSEKQDDQIQTMQQLASPVLQCNVQNFRVLMTVHAEKSL